MRVSWDCHWPAPLWAGSRICVNWRVSKPLLNLWGCVGILTSQHPCGQGPGYVSVVQLVGWVLLYIHRNRRLIRDGSPGRPPWLSHSCWALQLSRWWWWCRASCPRMSVDILGTNCDQCLSMLQCCFASTETVRLIWTESPWRPPRLSHSWTLHLSKASSKPVNLWRCLGNVTSQHPCGQGPGSVSAIQLQQTP